MSGPDFRCATCVWFCTYQRPGMMVPPSRGQCRRHAPVSYMDESGQMRSGWPMTHENAYCGEHAMIDVEEPPEDERQTDEEASRSGPMTGERFFTGIKPISNEPPPQIVGPQWRCINCKEITTSGTEPAKCVFCQCREFASVSI
jgi:hypothetical protein